MASKIATAALQYSKWLSKFICWVWALYRFFVLVAAVVEPLAAEHIAATIAGADTIMLVNVSTYLINSLGEKYIYSDRFVMACLKNGGWQKYLNRLVTKDEKDDEEEEEGDNG